MTCRQRWFRRKLFEARQRRFVWQRIIARGPKITGRNGEVFRVALFSPQWIIAKWNGHHWRVFDKATTLAVLNWRYGNPPL